MGICKISRRQWIWHTAVTSAAMRDPAAYARPAPGGCTLGMGTYGMPGMVLEEAVALVGSVGYDGIEIDAREGAHGDPSQLPPERRQRVRHLLQQQGLTLTSLMEHLYPSENEQEHASQTDRLKRAAALSRELAPEAPPLVQTVLGKGAWEEKKGLFRDRLGDWVEAMRAADTVLAIKPHRGFAVSCPSEAVWLINQLGDTPWLRMVYDYSHYAFRGMTVEETVQTALPYTALVVVKDVVETGGKPEFLLPGESGLFDYVKLLHLFHDGGYRGNVCCEVSAQLWKKPDYDPGEAAGICYRNMARAFAAAGITRGSRQDKAGG